MRTNVLVTAEKNKNCHSEVGRGVPIAVGDLPTCYAAITLFVEGGDTNDLLSIDEGPAVDYGTTSWRVKKYTVTYRGRGESIQGGPRPIRTATFYIHEVENPT